MVTSLFGMVICILLATVRLRGLLINSGLLAGGAFLVSLSPGVFLAVVVTKTSLPGRRLLEMLCVAMLFVPLVVQAAAWQAAAGQGGWLLPSASAPLLQGWVGAIWVHGVAAIPWVVLFVGAALRQVPRELEEDALQDTSSWRVLLAVSVRRAAAGIVASALWIAVLCTSEITVTDLFQLRTFAEEIYTTASLGSLVDPPMLSNGFDINSGAVPPPTTSELWLGTVAVTLLVTAALAAVWSWLSWKDFISPIDGWIWRLRRGRWILASAAWLLAAVVVAVPLVCLLGKAGAETSRLGDEVVRNWSATKAAELAISSPWEHRREWGWSLAIGGIAALAATGCGLVLAWVLRSHRLPALPVALALAFAFSIPGPLLGIWTIRVMNQPDDSAWSFLAWCYDNTVLAPVLVQFLRALPLATLVLGTHFVTVPQEVLDSATSEGAGWWRQLVNIVAPLHWPAIVAAGCMSLVVCLGELAATLLVAPPGVSTLPVRIFGLLHYGAEDRVAALCLMLALSLGLLATVAWQVPRWLNRPADNL